MNQRSLFLLLLVAYPLSGAFEVMDNLLGLRELNFESSAPGWIKILKELVLIYLLIFLAWQRRGRVSMSGLLFAFFFALILVVPSAMLNEATSARIGFSYLVASILLLLVCTEVAGAVEVGTLLKYFLSPLVVVILATQLLEIALAPVSLYHEDSLLGLDRRAGIAVIPTTAGCIGALAVFALRGWTRWVALLVVIVANSTTGWACMLLLALWRSSRWRHTLLLYLPLTTAMLIAVVLSRAGFETSVDARLALVEDSYAELRFWVPSAIGALATAKSVAIDPINSLIADSTMLEFVHVFGVLPGFALFFAVAFTLFRTCGSRGLVFFLVASSGFLLIESWTVSALMIFVLAVDNGKTYRKTADATRKRVTKISPASAAATRTPSFPSDHARPSGHNSHLTTSG